MSLLTLTAYWSNELATLTAALAATRTELATAQTDARGAGVALAAAGNAVRTTQDAVDAARKKLAGAAMPADGDPLLEAMRDAIKAWRQASADQMAQAAGAQQAEARREALQARVDALVAAQAEALLAQQREAKASTQRTQWATAATTVPVKGLPAAANAALTANKAAAVAAVEGDFPSNAATAKSFLDRARARRLLAQAAVDGAAAVAAASLADNTTWTESSTRKQDLVARKQREFDAAVEELRRFAESAPRVNQAVADLALLATGVSALTSAERAELITSNATLRTKRESALAKLAARDAAQGEWLTARTDYAKALYTARIAAPDKTDAELRAADAALQAKFDLIGTKATAVNDADVLLGNDSATSERTALKTWFAAAPDALWAQLDKLDDSVALLQATKAVVPANLVTAVNTAEDGLAQAVAAARLEARQVAARQQGLAMDQAAAAAAATLAGKRQQAVQRYMALA